MSRQAKGIQPEELLLYKEKLQLAISSGTHIDRYERLDGDEKFRIQRVEFDQTKFLEFDSLLDEEILRRLLDPVGGDHSYTRSRVAPLDAATDWISLEKNRFIGEELNSSLLRLNSRMIDLRTFLSRNFFCYPEKQNREDVNYAMYPDLNWDRGSPKSHEDTALYDKYGKELNDVCEKVEKAYADFRRQVRMSLLI